MNYYDEIKSELINNEINKKVKDYNKNKYELQRYYNVGKLLNNAGKHYGEGIIKEYSRRLTSELGKGYTESRLRYFRRFYIVFEKYPTLSDKLSFSHYCELIWFDKNKMNYYIKIVIDNNLSIRQLRNRIKSKEYERLPEETKNKLINKEERNIVDYVKNPILIRNKSNYEVISEKVLQRLILEDISSFLIGNRYNYIDLLLFNYEYNCFVVVELKVTELKKEHIGQIKIYMNYIDKNLKKITQDK